MLIMSIISSICQDVFPANTQFRIFSLSLDRKKFPTHLPNEMSRVLSFPKDTNVPGCTDTEGFIESCIKSHHDLPLRTCISVSLITSCHSPVQTFSLKHSSSHYGHHLLEHCTHVKSIFLNRSIGHFLYYRMFGISLGAERNWEAVYTPRCSQSLRRGTLV